MTATPIWTNTWLGVFPGRVSRGHKPKHDGEKLRLFLPYHSSKVRVAVKGRHRRCFDAAVKKAKHNGDYKDKPSAVLDPVKAALDGMMRRKMMSAWSSVNFCADGLALGQLSPSWLVYPSLGCVSGYNARTGSSSLSAGLGAVGAHACGRRRDDGLFFQMRGAAHGVLDVWLTGRESGGSSLFRRPPALKFQPVRCG